MRFLYIVYWQYFKEISFLTSIFQLRSCLKLFGPKKNIPSHVLFNWYTRFPINSEPVIYCFDRICIEFLFLMKTIRHHIKRCIKQYRAMFYHVIVYVFWSLNGIGTTFASAVTAGTIESSERWVQNGSCEIGNAKHLSQGGKHGQILNCGCLLIV